MDERSVLVDSSNPSLTVVTLNRPEKRNALSLKLMMELHRAVHAASADARCRTLILRGNGPAFCAGLDLAEASVAAGRTKSARVLAELYREICRSPLVTIAAVHGAVMGGGVGLIAACDLVVAAKNTQIGFPEVHRGLVAALVTALVRRQVDDRRLRELLLLGQTITAEHALTIGMVNRVTSSRLLLADAKDLAKQAEAGAPGAIVRTKTVLDRLSDRPIADNLDRALQHHLKARNAAEAAEGIAAFLEKRRPRWPLRSNQLDRAYD